MSTPKRNVEKTDRVLALRAASRTTRFFLVAFSPYQHAFQRHQETVPDNLQKENIMSNKLANLTQNSNGTFTGTLRTMNVTTKITVAPISNPSGDDKHPDYRITAGSGFEIGAAWKRTSETTGNEYLSVKLEAPEIGASAIYTNIITLDEIGEDGTTHLMLWSAREVSSMAA